MNHKGTIITFYSYKGGTGRSMSIANIACLMSKKYASSSNRILMIDFDLEAPGLHNFFSKISKKLNDDYLGVINYFHAMNHIFKKDKSVYLNSISNDYKLLENILPIHNYIIPDVMPNLDMMKAGHFNLDYSALVTSFDWYTFYRQFGESIRVFREIISSKYKFILIDSRTGLTDISGICSMLLPEKLVGVFTPNLQSIDGLLSLVKQAIEYRRSSDDFRPLAVFPLPSRIDIDEPRRRQEWRNAYQKKFENLFKEIYDLESCHLSDYFDDIQLPHTKYYAYGEDIAVLVEERNDSLSLSRAYQNFFKRLIEGDYAWQSMNTDIKVFISYASEDYTIAEKLHHDLKQAGINSWLDKEDLLPGQKLKTTIGQIIQESNYFLFLISHHSLLDHGDLNNEQKMILNILDEYSSDIIIIPVKLDNTKILNDRFNDIQWADLSNYEKGFKQL